MKGPTGVRWLAPPRSLYVHVPFCRQRCHYCDFSLVRSAEPPIVAWLDALGRDLTEWFSDAGWARGPKLETIYVGGGTPSLLGATGMRELGNLLHEWFRWDPDRIEWTAEANPRSLTGAVCDAWLATGVNRISIGVQSFHDGALEWLGRQHDSAEAAASVKRARAAGFTDVSIDLMFGLPPDISRDWPLEVERAVELGATHVSAYGLAVEARTALGKWVELGRRFPCDENSYAVEYLLASELLTGVGFGQYEVSNFAQSNHESLHNWHYWDGSGYVGIGPSAHSFLPPHRIWNVHRWDAYRKAAEAGASLRAGREKATPEQAALERLWLGLRTRRGIAGTELDMLSEDTRRRLLEDWTGAKWMEQDGARWRLTPAGWLLLDKLALELADKVETEQRRAAT